MSRIGKEPITLPAGVKVEIKGTVVKVTGGKGSLQRTIRPEIAVKLEDGKLFFEAKGNSTRVGAFWGLTRTLINNMIIGVDKGYQKKLAVEGVGYRASAGKSSLTLNVGYSNAVEFPLPDGISAEVDKDNVITVIGIDKELVGQTAAQIRQVRKPEPYKGKGIRYVDEHVSRKAGKAQSKK